jgi:hypothetical protein
LRERERLTREAEELDRRAASPLGVAERRRVREMAADLGKVWRATTTGMEDRKELLRFLVHRVYLDGVTEAGRIRIEVEWHTGARTQVTVPRPAVGAGAPRTPAAAADRIRVLLPTHEYSEIAAMLNAEGYRTAKGLGFDVYSVGYVARSRGWGRSVGKRSEGDVQSLVPYLMELLDAGSGLMQMSTVHVPAGPDRNSATGLAASRTASSGSSSATTHLLDRVKLPGPGPLAPIPDAIRAFDEALGAWAHGPGHRDYADLALALLSGVNSGSDRGEIALPGRPDGSGRIEDWRLEDHRGSDPLPGRFAEAQGPVDHERQRR